MTFLPGAALLSPGIFMSIFNRNLVLKLDLKRKVYLMIRTIQTFRRRFRAYYATCFMSMKQMFDGGILCVAGEYLVRFIQFAMLVCIWKSLAEEGTDLGGMTLPSLLTYTLMSSALHQQFNIVSPATSALWEGSIIGRYMRPFPVIGSFISETVGRWWIPVFLFYGLPLWLAAPVFGIRALPANAVSGGLAIVSLAASVSIGFALDLLFAAMAMRLKNGCFAVVHVRESIFSLLSGELIPFALFPWGLGKVFALTPFGSISHVPLTIYTGMEAQPIKLIGLQIFWNLVLWPLALVVFHKSEERMISFGG